MSETPQIDPSLSDQIAGESGDTPDTIERPAGAPHLFPFMRLPRRLRAAFFRKLQNLPTDDKGNLEIDMATMGIQGAADAFELLADLEDALKLAARDPKEYANWATACDDGELVQLFGWYMQRFQPGEVSASPSS